MKSTTTDVGSSLSGGNGNDSLIGAAGPDILHGDAGDVSLQGGGGDDTLDGGTGADFMSGGDGNDTVDYSSRTNGVYVGIGTLADDGEPGEKDNVQLDIETVIGGSGNDTIHGGAASNLLVGNGGNDQLFGNFGDDTLSGNAGTDTLNGENGTDTAINSSGDALVSIEACNVVAERDIPTTNIELRGTVEKPQPITRNTPAWPTSVGHVFNLSGSFKNPNLTPPRSR